LILKEFSTPVSRTKAGWALPTLKNPLGGKKFYTPAVTLNFA